MNNISHYVFQCHLYQRFRSSCSYTDNVFLGNGDVSVGGDLQPLLVQAIPNTDSTVVSSYPHSYNANGVSCLSNELLRDLCSGYGYSVSFDEISQTYDDNFLHVYAVKCGYELTKDFLSTMLKSKRNFMEKINSILVDLCGSFSFLKDLDGDTLSVTDLVNKFCSSFSKNVYDLRPRCIEVLRSDIIPVVISSILDSKDIVCISEREMTYQEMEQLFVYFITVLEKLIAVRIMEYWKDFCNKNKSLFLLTPTVNYSNPFACAYYSGVRLPKINYPAAFVHKFGVNISFMALYSIDVMKGNFVRKCVDVLKDTVHCSCYYIYNYSSRVYSDVIALRNGLHILIKEEFDRKISEENFVKNFAIFFDKLMIWDSPNWGGKVVKKNTLLITKLVVNDIYKSLMYDMTNYMCSIIKNYQPKMILLSKIDYSADSSFLCGIESKWKIKLHPDDNYNISFIRSKFLSKSKLIVWGKFCSMISGQYEFSDGTHIAMVDWEEISGRLLPIAKETVSFLIDDELLEIRRVLFNARVVEDVGIFDGFCEGTREATSDEKDSILRIAASDSNTQTENVLRDVWGDLIKYKKTSSTGSFRCISSIYDLSECSNNYDADLGVDVDCTLLPFIVKNGSLLVLTSLGQGELPITTETIDRINYASLGNAFLFIRRNFSEKIRDHIHRLLHSIFEGEITLSGGKFVSDSHWSMVSGELYRVALKSSESFVNSECVELEIFLSKSRMVDLCKNDVSSFIFRKVSDDEKNNIIKRAKVLMYRWLRICVREIWINLSAASVSKNSMDESELRLVSSVPAELTYVSSVSEANLIISKWGLNLHPDDDRKFFFLKKSFQELLPTIFVHYFLVCWIGLWFFLVVRWCLAFLGGLFLGNYSQLR
ncbi:putative membrane protein [Candidatus Ichthyocystis hellenicum]|uniref:Putative membrane protein n=1 Tax=Candidatus Ichthyocystis hellenicum TaxID=1561003 RepID=A0A0S4M485_9BURK|nr:hypothetical protein [Candidatus Ichthyocystis hellenicum]CUT17666.1 putative membrane protein [Candidatus Ichthyocystis hellenicum]